jgi:hypothetical protein
MNKEWLLRVRNQVRQQRNGRPNRRIFYMHIPKCAGTSVANAIRNSFMTLDPADDQTIFHMDPFAAHEAAVLSQQDPLGYYRQLLRYVLGSNEYRYVYGHFAFDEIAYEAFSQKFSFMTLLRDPVKKWLSLYFFNRHKKDNFFKIEDDLESFIQTPLAVGYGCDYVMQFAGRYAREPFPHEGYNYDNYTTQAAIDHAIGNLCKFQLVGLLEQLDLFVDQFEQLYGAKLSITHKNRSPVNQQQQKQVVSDAMLAKIHELCTPNFAIYNYAAEHLLYAKLDKE